MSSISDLGSTLISPLTAIKDGVAGIPGAIGDTLEGLFIPDPDYFQDQFEDIRQALYLRLSITSYETLMDDIKNVLAADMPSIKATIPVLGYEVSLIDFKWIQDAKPYYFPWVRGVMFVLLLIGNYNHVYKLIRGTDLSGVTQTMQNMGGGKK